MSDDIVKTLLESLTDEQKSQLVQGLLQSSENKETSVPKEETVSSENPQSNITDDFRVIETDDKLEKRKSVVRARKNKWVDDGEFRDDEVDYQKLEKMKTPRRRGKPKKRSVECHICGKTFSINESLIHGEFLRCNRCTGR
tara:strand:- start:626 stop:1048 length:423 start_codon:yes stop_codon:yes gene_type:complete